jgi:hypothetical protein
VSAAAGPLVCVLIELLPASPGLCWQLEASGAILLVSAGNQVEGGGSSAWDSPFPKDRLVSLLITMVPHGSTLLRDLSRVRT